MPEHADECQSWTGGGCDCDEIRALDAAAFAALPAHQRAELERVSLIGEAFHALDSPAVRRDLRRLDERDKRREGSWDD